MENYVVLCSHYWLLWCCSYVAAAWLWILVWLKHHMLVLLAVLCHLRCPPQWHRATMFLLRHQRYQGSTWELHWYPFPALRFWHLAWFPRSGWHSGVFRWCHERISIRWGETIVKPFRFRKDSHLSCSSVSLLWCPYRSKSNFVSFPTSGVTNSVIGLCY